MLLGKMCKSLIKYEEYCEDKEMRSENNEFIFGLDNIFEEVTKYCKKLLEDDNEFKIAKKRLSITPTFLFYGLPGTGKTTLANLIYRNIKTDYNIDIEDLRMDQLISSNFGESSKNLIKFFDDIRENQSKNNSKTFIIIDEMDSFTLNRFQNDNESMKRILLSFNTIIDQLDQKGEFENIIIIATTNMIESIDTSVLRRFFFQYDFNVSLDEKDFCEYISKLKEMSKCFDTIDKNFSKEIYEIYKEKHFTLGEIKKIFAEWFMDAMVSKQPLKINSNLLKKKQSFYEIAIKQQEEL